MERFEVIEVGDPMWSEIVQGTVNYDFYHTSCYHSQESGRSVLFVAFINNDYIAMPLVIRQIHGTEYFDCTSAYGYCGPISSKLPGEMEERLIGHFSISLKTYFLNNNIIAVFSRLHPISGTDEFLKNFGRIQPLNKTVAIDLRLTLDEQRKQFRKSNKSEITQLIRKGYTIRHAKGEADIETFASIYTETMNRVGANANYFFDLDYFKGFLNSQCYNSQLLLATKDNIIAGGAIFTMVRDVMQYHLAGTNAEFMKDTPMKLIINEARKLGMQNGCKYLHLGGGVGGSDNDSLYKFKSGFSDLNFNFSVWQFISNEKVYHSLVAAEVAKRELKTNFFPLYRG